MARELCDCWCHSFHSLQWDECPERCRIEEALHVTSRIERRRSSFISAGLPGHIWIASPTLNLCTNYQNEQSQRPFKGNYRSIGDQITPLCTAACELPYCIFPSITFHIHFTQYRIAWPGPHSCTHESGYEALSRYFPVS